MKYNGIEFDAIVTTPACGKTYLTSKYPDMFVDVDDLRMRLKYYVPEGISYSELESTKTKRTFEKRLSGEELDKELNRQIDVFLKEGKIMLFAPNLSDILVKKGIKYALVYPDDSAKEDLVSRLIARGNPQSMVDETIEKFDYFNRLNESEEFASVKYRFKNGEYLEDIVKKFGIKI